MEMLEATYWLLSGRYNDEQIAEAARYLVENKQPLSFKNLHSLLKGVDNPSSNEQY